MTLDHDLQNLTMVGSLPPGGRIVHRDGRIYVEHTNPFNAVLRRLRGEGRDRTVASIRLVLTSVDERLTDMANSRMLQGDPESSSAADLGFRVAGINRALQQCSGGIRNLQATYVGDASTKAAIDLVLEKALAIAARADALHVRLTSREFTH